MVSPCSSPNNRGPRENFCFLPISFRSLSGESISTTASATTVPTFPFPVLTSEQSFSMLLIWTEDEWTFQNTPGSPTSLTLLKAPGLWTEKLLTSQPLYWEDRPQTISCKPILKQNPLLKNIFSLSVLFL